MNCISLIPTNFFQGIGKPRITTLIVLAELPLYLGAMWFAINDLGVTGAAMVFMIAGTINVLTLFLIANKFYAIRSRSKAKEFFFLLCIIILVVPFFMNDIYIKIIFSIGIIVTFSLIAWKFILSFEEKLFITSKLKIKPR